jgi:hypothetical protein
MGLALPADRTPTSATAIEARWCALNPRIRAKLTTLEGEKESRHGAMEGSAAIARRQDEWRSCGQPPATPQTRTPYFVVGRGGQPGEGSGNGVAAVPTSGPRRPSGSRKSTAWPRRRRVDALYSVAQARWQIVARLFQSCRDWVEATPIGAVAPIVVSYARVADPRAEVATIRERLVALAAEAAAITRAPVPLAEALARLEAQRTTVAARVAARRADAVPAFFSPRGVTDAILVGRSPGFGTSGREIEEVLRELADARFLATVGEWETAIRAHRGNGTTTIASADRPQRLAALARERAALDQQEEALVLAAERDGFTLDRRGDAEPSVVVCVLLADATA